MGLTVSDFAEMATCGAQRRTSLPLPTVCRIRMGQAPAGVSGHILWRGRGAEVGPVWSPCLMLPLPLAWICPRAQHMAGERRRGCGLRLGACAQGLDRVKRIGDIVLNPIRGKGDIPPDRALFRIQHSLVPLSAAHNMHPFRLGAHLSQSTQVRITGGLPLEIPEHGL
jgi:hypothetical protein